VTCPAVIRPTGRGEIPISKLFRVLLEEDLTFTDWLRKQVDAYLAEKEPKGKRRMGKGA
jgi:hypothetical protein